MAVMPGEYSVIGPDRIRSGPLILTRFPWANRYPPRSKTL
jgi:hypothetical protein